LDVVRYFGQRGVSQGVFLSGAKVGVSPIALHAAKELGTTLAQLDGPPGAFYA
jgi:hypothetical protein